MFNGAHYVIFSEEPERDRALMAELLGLDAVDAGGGWMIFEMPPSELAIHPPWKDRKQELHMLCQDIESTRAALEEKGLTCDPVEDMGYGLVSGFTLPGGTTIGFYQPNHALAAKISARS